VVGGAAAGPDSIVYLKPEIEGNRVLTVAMNAREQYFILP